MSCIFGNSLWPEVDAYNLFLTCTTQIMGGGAGEKGRKGGSEREKEKKRKREKERMNMMNMCVCWGLRPKTTVF